MADENEVKKVSSFGDKAYKQNKTQYKASRTRKQKKKKKEKTHRPVTQVVPQVRKDNSLITKYHALRKRLEAVSKDKRLSQGEKTLKANAISSKMEKLGGLNAYQKASKLGESRHGGFNSAKWVVRQLKEHDVQAQLLSAEDKRLKLLDVGALDHNYRKQRGWIECTPIDLNPQNNTIMKMDFLKFDTKSVYHVVVLSLVLNFEGDPHKRGEMLRKCSKLICPDGYVFVVLPLPCLSNSRFLSVDIFHSMMESLGFTVCTEHDSKKLHFVMFKRAGERKSVSFPRRTTRKGDGHNNFSIIL